ncbi:MAG: hypothetical protein J6B46_00345 [Parabacteroides sp.]|nr:hypothetical protein [Parabacteroides sp.]
MKKQIIKLLAVVAVVAIAGWNYMNSENDVQMSDLTLDNIEALAQGEIELEFICVGSYYECHEYPDGEILWGIKQNF